MSSILLTVAYDGGPFSGWAKQEGTRTVAGELLGAIQAMDPSVTEVRGASRTDAGVHAKGQLAAFDHARDIAPKGWALGLSAHLPAEIAIRGAARVPDGCDPRGIAVRKHYRYLVLRDALRDPFWEGRALRFSHQLDIHALRRESRALVGTHDFAAFQSAGTETKTTVRTISRSDLTADGCLVTYEVEGDGFLRHMVRAIVGTLVEIGRGWRHADSMARLIDGGSRAQAGATAPPHGLALVRVAYH